MPLSENGKKEKTLCYRELGIQGVSSNQDLEVKRIHLDFSLCCNETNSNL